MNRNIEKCVWVLLRKSTKHLGSFMVLKLQHAVIKMENRLFEWVYPSLFPMSLLPCVCRRMRILRESIKWLVQPRHSPPETWTHQKRQRLDLLCLTMMDGHLNVLKTTRVDHFDTEKPSTPFCCLSITLNQTFHSHLIKLIWRLSTQNKTDVEKWLYFLKQQSQSVVHGHLSKQAL